jgi:hypothetical protein
MQPQYAAKLEQDVRRRKEQEDTITHHHHHHHHLTTTPTSPIHSPSTTITTAMSLQDMMNPATTEVQTFDNILKDTSKQPLRSWRKKYRKMKLRFDKAMDESSSLFRDCHKLEILAKRLQEENECASSSPYTHCYSKLTR